MVLKGSEIIRKGTIAIGTVVVVAGSAATYAVFSLNQNMSDTGVPKPPIDVISSPGFIIPSTIVLAIVLVTIALIYRRDKSMGDMLVQSTTNDQPTGFRVGKKTIGGTRVKPVEEIGEGAVDPSSQTDRFVPESQSTGNGHPTGFRVGKKTTSGT